MTGLTKLQAIQAGTSPKIQAGLPRYHDLQHQIFLIRKRLLFALNNQRARSSQGRAECQQQGNHEHSQIAEPTGLHVTARTHHLKYGQLLAAEHSFQAVQYRHHLWFHHEA